MMSRGHNPLFWMMAAALPTAGHALGLGEIHVDSALNEPLAAEIDIVGAAPDELVGLIATVANRETFSHFGAERPSFLNTTTFKVTKDASGKPILAIRSSESFTEPLIDFVVDLRWRNGQLIRQYSLLLDPAGYPTTTQSATALPVPPTQSTLPAPVVSAAAAPSASAPALPVKHLSPRTVVTDAGATAGASAAASTRSMTEIKVGPKATLRGIAWRIGARSDADLNQMMIAIFHANPSAFDGNINRLRLGATLKIPSADEVAAVSRADANRETHAQMQAWRENPKRPAANAASVASAQPAANSAATAPVNSMPANSTAAKPAPASAAPASVAPANAVSTNPAPTPTATTSAAATDTTAAPATADKAALTSKILSLEGSLQDIQAQLEAQHNKLLTMQAQVRYAEQHPKTVAAPVEASSGNRGLLTAALAGMAVLAGVCVALFMRLRSRVKPGTQPSIDKVPVVAPLDIEPPAPVARPKPAPVITVRAPEPSRIEVHEEPREPLIEAHTPKVDQPQHEQEHEPSESALELSAADTSGINAAKLREELAAAKLREEIAAAWALPAAETYKREDINHESTLAEDIAKSLEDTIRLQGSKPASSSSDTLGGDTIEEAYSDDAMAIDDTGTMVGAEGETANFAATEVLPEATMKMSADDFPNEIDPNNLDFDLMALEESYEDKAAATDKMKVTGELKLASDEFKDEFKLGADDPKLSDSLEDELDSWSKKSA